MNVLGVRDGTFYVKNNSNNIVCIVTIKKLTDLIVMYTTYPDDDLKQSGFDCKMTISDFTQKYTIIEEIVK